MRQSHNLEIFARENLRDKLASSGKIDKFASTYDHFGKDLRNLNSAAFWDKKISNNNENTKYGSIYADKLEIVAKYLKRLRGSLLDVGVGSGDIESELVQKKTDLILYGVDISPYAIKKISGKFKGSFKIASVYNLPFDNLFFDHVIALDVLEHIPDLKIFDAYKEIHRVLRKNGTFTVSVPLNEGLQEMLERGENLNGHLRAYTPDIIKAELKLAGFKIIDEKYLYAFDKHYIFKSIIMKLIPQFPRKPNLAIIFSIKR